MDDDSNRLSRDPVRPLPPAPPRSGGSFLTVAIASGLGLLALGALCFLTLPLAPVVMAAAGLIFVLAGVAAFHYFVWGWWLSGIIRDEVEEEERKKAEDEGHKSDEPD